MEVEAEALENEADSLKQRLQDFDDEEPGLVSLRQEIVKEVKPVHVPENSMTSDGAHMFTSTPKQDGEAASNEGFHVETPANTIILRSSMDSLPKLTP